MSRTSSRITAVENRSIESEDATTRRRRYFAGTEWVRMCCVTNRAAAGTTSGWRCLTSQVQPGRQFEFVTCDKSHGVPTRKQQSGKGLRCLTSPLVLSFVQYNLLHMHTLPTNPTSPLTPSPTATNSPADSSEAPPRRTASHSAPPTHLPAANTLDNLPDSRAVSA